MSNFSGNVQEKIAELFIGVVAEKHPAVADVLRAKVSLLNNDKTSRNADLANLYADLSSRDRSFQLLVAEMDAKLIDVQWRARKTAGIAVVNAVAQSRQVRTGDTFSEIIERFCRKNLPPAVVQSLLHYAHVWPSLTTHPTNPASLAYTLVGLRLDRILADTTTSTTRMVTVLRDIRDASMEYDSPDGPSGKKLLKKTPALEITELLAILNVLYDSAVGPQLRLREALDRFGYGEVASDVPLVNVNVWGAGDGDGNPNMNYLWLQEQVAALRQAIRKRYVSDLQHGNVDLSSDQASAFTTQKEFIISQLMQNRYPSAESLTNDLVALKGLLPQALSHTGSMPPDVARAAQHIHELIIKSRTFGLRFAGTDVRHNSVDIMESVSSLLMVVKAIGKKEEFLALPSAEQCKIMRPILDDAIRRDEISKMSIEEITAKLGEVGARVFLRMRVIAAHPDMFQKLIIAETRSAANAVAALLLLKYAGNKVAEAGTQIAVVPLFESRQDLQEAPATFHTLATDETFGRHIRCLGYFIAMIAKSDTTRLSGPGVQGRQEETVGRLMSVNPESYGGGFQMNIFVGGGDDQMRGGGRIVETPHVLMLAANRLGATKPSRFAMTIQGLQMQLVFGSRLLSEHFVEAFASQQMLAAARLEEHIRYRPVPKICNRKSADQSAHDFFNDAMDRYEFLLGSPHGLPAEVAQRETIVRYFQGYPSTIVASANKSSRPMARKKTIDPIQGRAISLDQLSKHDGSYITATLGVADALEALHNNVRTGAPEKEEAQFLSPLRHAYLANKSFRDFVRMQAVVLFQKDYLVSWGCRGGRPSETEIVKLAQECRLCIEAGKPASPRAFLAHVEEEDKREARMLLVAIAGVDPSTIASVHVREPLTVGWPDLAQKMIAREKQGVLCQMIVDGTIPHLQQDTTSVDEFFQRMAYYGYVGVNPKFSTPNFSLSMTDPQKEGHGKTSESAPQVVCRLVTPLWAQKKKLSKL